MGEALEITYKNARIEKQCTQWDVACKAFGKELAVAVFKRLEQLAAADNLMEFRTVDPKFEALRKKPFIGCYSSRLNKQFRIIVKPVAPVPVDDSGGVDLANIREITIMEACHDYHK